MASNSVNYRVGDRAIANADFLSQLGAKTRGRNQNVLRADIIRNATSDQLLTLVELCYNILRSRIPLTSVQRRVLCEHAREVRKLARARCEKSARKILLCSEMRRTRQRRKGKKMMMPTSRNQIGRGFPLAMLLSSAVLPLISKYVLNI